MISDKQLSANRENAKKSTGPKTTAGKARSARNALQHGLYCQEVVLPWEDPNAYKELEDSFWDTCNPVDAIEAALARQMTAAEWKLQRTQRAEAHGLLFRGNLAWSEERMRDIGKPDLYPAETEYELTCMLDGRTSNQYTGPVDRLNTYAKAEATVHRNFNRAVELFDKRRSQRRKEAIEDAKLGMQKRNPIPPQVRETKRSVEAEQKAKPFPPKREKRPSREVQAMSDKQLVKLEADRPEKPPKKLKNA